MTRFAGKYTIAIIVAMRIVRFPAQTCLAFSYMGFHISPAQAAGGTRSPNENEPGDIAAELLGGNMGANVLALSLTAATPVSFWVSGFLSNVLRSLKRNSIAEAMRHLSLLPFCCCDMR